MKSSWTIVYRNGAQVFFFNGREVPEAEYRRRNPSRFHEIATSGQLPFSRPRDSGWEAENGGRGRYIGQLGKITDPKCYHRSVTSAKEEARRQGFEHIEDA